MVCPELPERRNAKAGPGSNAPFQLHMEETLADISVLLAQMLRLAQIAASDGEIDRDALQRQLDSLRTEIDRLADTLPETDGPPSLPG